MGGGLGGEGDAGAEPGRGGTVLPQPRARSAWMRDSEDDTLMCRVTPAGNSACGAQKTQVEG